MRSRSTRSLGLHNHLGHAPRSLLLQLYTFDSCESLSPSHNHKRGLGDWLRLRSRSGGRHGRGLAWGKTFATYMRNFPFSFAQQHRNFRETFANVSGDATQHSSHPTRSPGSPPSENQDRQGVPVASARRVGDQDDPPKARKSATHELTVSGRETRATVSYRDSYSRTKVVLRGLSPPSAGLRSSGRYVLG